MKAVAAALLLGLLVVAVLLVMTPAQPHGWRPVGCDVLTRDYPYDNCTPRPS